MQMSVLLCENSWKRMQMLTACTSQNKLKDKHISSLMKHVTLSHSFLINLWIVSEHVFCLKSQLIRWNSTVLQTQWNGSQSRWIYPLPIASGVIPIWLTWPRARDPHVYGPYSSQYQFLKAKYISSQQGV